MNFVKPSCNIYSLVQKFLLSTILPSHILWLTSIAQQNTGWSTARLVFRTGETQSFHLPAKKKKKNLPDAEGKR